mmetsp:Transcript_5002/g.8066  ORF Transcript_5002/g.8066 Transcript_5002/m.8066 type:complete len:216 (+) Transcript_5002:538-1185(+)
MSSSNASSWVPSTKAVRTNSRWSRAAWVSMLRAPNRSSASASSPLASASASSSRKSLSAEAFLFLSAFLAFEDCGLRLGLEGSLTLFPVSPSSTASAASSHGFSTSIFLEAGLDDEAGVAGVSGAISDRPPERLPFSPFLEPLRTLPAGAAETPRTVSGPETVHSVVLSSFSSISSTSLLAFANSSSVKLTFFALAASWAAPGRSSALSSSSESP